MSNADVQKKIYERWKGYSSDPAIKEIALRDQKIRKYIKEGGKNKTILDIGCADGMVIGTLIKDHKVTGIEISKNLAKKAREKGIDVIEANVEQGIPLPSGTFDLVIAAEILEHIVNTDFFLAECNRVLKKRGVLVLSVPNINTLFAPLIMFLFDYPPPSSSRYGSPHVKDFTLSTLIVALENNGFRVEKKCGKLLFIPFFPYLLSLRSMVANIVPRFADELIVKAKKVRSIHYDEREMVKRVESRSVIKKIVPFVRWFIR